MTDTADQIFKVLPRQLDKTVAAALREWLPGRSWSQIQQLLKSRHVMLSGNLCMDAGRRLRLADVVKVLAQPYGAAAQGRSDSHPLSGQERGGGGEAGGRDHHACTPRNGIGPPAAGNCSPPWMSCCRG